MAKWCNFYNVWCEEAEDIIDESDYCDFDCSDCDHKEEVQPQH